MNHFVRFPSTESGTFPASGTSSASAALLDRATMVALQCRSLLRDGAVGDARDQYVLLLRLLRTLSALSLTGSRAFALDGLRAERDALRAELRSAVWRSGVHDAV